MKLPYAGGSRMLIKSPVAIRNWPAPAQRYNPLGLCGCVTTSGIHCLVLACLFYFDFLDVQTENIFLM